MRYSRADRLVLTLLASRRLPFGGAVLFSGIDQSIFQVGDAMHEAGDADGAVLQVFDAAAKIRERLVDAGKGDAKLVGWGCGVHAVPDFVEHPVEFGDADNDGAVRVGAATFGLQLAVADTGSERVNAQPGVGRRGE